MRANGRLLNHAAAFGAAIGLLAMVHTPASAQVRRIDEPARSVFVDSGKSARIFFFWGLNEDCSIKTGFNVRVERMPKHGEVRLEKNHATIGPGWISGAKSRKTASFVEKCQGKDTLVISVHYQSNPGYRGFDDLMIINTSSDGRAEYRYEYRLAVR